MQVRAAYLRTDLSTSLLRCFFCGAGWNTELMRTFRPTKRLFHNFAKLKHRVMWANYQYFSYWLQSLYLLETILVKSSPVTGMTERHRTVESQLLIVIYIVKYTYQPSWSVCYPLSPHLLYSLRMLSFTSHWLSKKNVLPRNVSSLRVTVFDIPRASKYSILAKINYHPSFGFT